MYRTIFVLGLLGVVLFISHTQAPMSNEVGIVDTGDEVLININEAVVTLQLQEGVTLDEAIDSMKLHANLLNMKFVGHQPLSEEYKALGLTDIRRTEIFQFCDASVAKQMLDFDINFLAYMPCRIGVIEDAEGKGWLVTMNLNMFVTAEGITPELKEMAIRVRNNIEQIMEAGAAGDL